MVWVAICDKTGLLTGEIAASLAATGIGSLPGMVLAGLGVTCGALLRLLSVIEKRHNSSSKRYHAIYTHSCVAAASLQERISAAVIDGEFTIDEFKVLEKKYRVYLYSVDTDVQKTPASKMDGKPETLEESISFHA